MNRFLLRAALPAGVVCLFTGCIDNNYDLSDIDTTSELKVQDLVLPVNLDSIRLDDIIEIDDDSKIKIVELDGRKIYAVTESGTISSDPIFISDFSAPAPAVESSQAIFAMSQASTRTAVSDFYSFSSFTPQTVSYLAENIDEAILEVTALDVVPMVINIHFQASGLGANTSMKFETLNVDFLKGLTISNLPSNFKYNPVSGLLEVTDLPFSGNHADINLTATAINLSQAGSQLKDHSLAYASEIDVLSGVLQTTTENPGPSDRPQSITFDVTTTVGDLNATAIDGRIEYSLSGDDLNIDPVDLSDIPDFLAGDETDIRLVNPQIYLSLNNPLATEKLNITSGIELTSHRTDESSTFNLDAGQQILIGHNHGDGPYNVVLSPSMPATPLPEYAANLTHVGYKSLSNVLAGAGLPYSIDISLIEPGVPSQTVSGFPLGVELQKVEGSYEFFAPLALADGDNASVIVYSTTEDGWSDEDVDKITITSLTVSALATSDLPLGATVSVVPFDKFGNEYEGIVITPGQIAANAKDEALEVVITPTKENPIRNLDGVRIRAVVKSASTTTLSPDQSITLKKVRAKVSGSYTTDF